MSIPLITLNVPENIILDKMYQQDTPWVDSQVSYDPDLGDMESITGEIAVPSRIIAKLNRVIRRTNYMMGGYSLKNR
jgi:hypothetical protein